MDPNEILEMILPKWIADTGGVPDPDLVFFYTEMDSRDMWLDEDVSLSTVGRIVKMINWYNHQPSNEPVRLHIASNGGELDAMFMLYHAIKTSRVPIHTINEARCHSAAFIIFLAGHKRTMSPFASFIAHEGSGVIGGSFRETRAAMAQYERDVNNMMKIIAKETKLEEDYVKQKLSQTHDWHINYEEALQEGIITEEQNNG